MLGEPCKENHMLTIYATTERWPDIQQAIQRVDRLEELIYLRDLNDPVGQADLLYLTVLDGEILIPFFWDNRMPPYLLPERVAWSETHLLGLIFHLLENDEKAWEYLNGSELYAYIERQNKLRYGLPLLLENDSPSTYREWHNQGVILHYGNVPRILDSDPELLYKQALAADCNGEEAAFTLRELATLYMDQGRLADAEVTVEQGMDRALSEEGRNALLLLRLKIWMEQLVVPYHPQQMERLKLGIWHSLTYFEKHGQMAQVGLLLLDATHIANISESYSEALGYIKRAIGIFETEDLPELAASAKLQKGTLLGTWAQNGNPQFYKPAIESYQQALYVFTKEQNPDVFADVQHKLGVLYAEMPDEHKKRGIWAGVASASFHAALEYYTKERFPYEYASICNNFANAYTKFPPSIRSDNHGKALAYYEEALEIRKAHLPYERAITLLNYLEASWNVGNDPTSFHLARYDDMIGKAEEVKALVDDPEMIATANHHLENLTKLRQILEKEQANA